MQDEKFISLEEFMNDIGLDIDTCVYNENVITDIKKVFKNAKEDTFVKDTIAKIQSNTNKTFHKIKKLTLTDSRLLKENVKKMKEAKSFSQYKSEFKKFCNKLDIPDNNVVITKYKFDKDSDGRPQIEYKYGTSPVKIFIPQGYALYHKSQVNGLKELKPFYCGKANMGYLYDKPRIYCSIQKNMNNFAADISVLKGTDPKDKTHLYIIDEPIKTGYIDPLLNTYLFGAFYIETNTPIKVKQIR